MTTDTRTDRSQPVCEPMSRPAPAAEGRGRAVTADMKNLGAATQMLIDSASLIDCQTLGTRTGKQGAPVIECSMVGTGLATKAQPTLDSLKYTPGSPKSAVHLIGYPTSMMCEARRTSDPSAASDNVENTPVAAATDRTSMSKVRGRMSTGQS